MYISIGEPEPGSRAFLGGVGAVKKNVREPEPLNLFRGSMEPEQEPIKTLKTTPLSQ